jgi:hypothetical protein
MNTLITLPTLSPNGNGHAIGNSHALRKHGGGPKTLAGKMHSRLNALKHGLSACDTIFLTGLDPAYRAAYIELRQMMRRHYRPASEMERLLVDRISIAQFRLLSLHRLEARAIESTNPRFILEESIIPHLDRFSRFDLRTERQIRILHNRLVHLFKSRGVTSHKPFSFHD